MSRIDVIKENIQFEQLLNESNTTTMLNEEYLIPDTHPDVEEVLMVDARPVIVSKETNADKLMVEGKVEYNVLYLAREENLVVCSVNYSQKFTSSLDLEEAEHRMVCEVNCRVEHIEAQIINERKLSINGVLDFNWEVYKRKEIELIKDIEGTDGVEVLKKSEAINKTCVDEMMEMVGKSVIRVSMDKPQISRILKANMTLQKKEIKVLEDKIFCGCYCKIGILYLGNENKEVNYLEDNVYLSKELNVPEASQDMAVNASFELANKDINIEEDDLGEARIANVEFIVKCKVKAFSKENVDVIMDAYSPKFPVEISKQECDMGMLHGIYNNEVIVKDNISIREEDMKPESIITSLGNVMITDKKVVDDKIVLEGFIKAYIIYRTNDDDKYIGKVEGELSFNTNIDALGANPDMKAIVRATIEDLDVSIEANTIAVKANVSVNAKLMYKVKKELVSDVIESDGEEIKKKSSITIYVVGSGDTLWKLAKKYNTTVNEIMRLNEMEEGAILQIGEKLLIPGRAVS